MVSKTSYQPPSAETMAKEQNSDVALKLLVAQRAIYSKAKRFLTVRLLGMFIIAILAPVVGGLKPDLAVICGAVAGAWLFAGRTWLTSRQNVEVDRGAAVQEEFDSRVFGMPSTVGRENAPSLEEIDRIAGRGLSVKRQARHEKLRDWYPFESKYDAVVAVAICQRANVSYSDALLRKTARVWRICFGSWCVAAVALSIFLHVDFETFLLVLVLPLLPAFLDLAQFWRDYDSASHIRRTTANEIEQALKEKSRIDPGNLLVWQERMYELRRTTPLVPDVIYWIDRKANERAMKSAADQLGSR